MSLEGSHLPLLLAKRPRRVKASGAGGRHCGGHQAGGDDDEQAHRVGDRIDWNAELVRGDLGKAVQQLKREPGEGLLVGGVTLPLALAELGLIDEYEFVVQPRLAGHGPTLFAGLSKHIDLKLVSRLEFGSGAVAMRYEPRR